MKDKWTRYEYRRTRTRGKLAQRPEGRPRLSVQRSLKHLYAQVIDDGQGKVPYARLEPILVTRDLMNATVIKDGFHTAADIYRFVPRQ